MWRDLGDFILSLKPLKVAEVGVGAFNKTYDYLKNKNIDIIKTDISPKDSETIKDNIENPNLNIYKNVDLIYSIRPPYEIQPYLINLKDKLNATLIIKPLFNEDLNTNQKMKLKNYKKADFYILYGEEYD